MAEHMFARWKELKCAPTPDMIENLADLLYEIGKQALTNRSYEVALKWLGRAFDMLGEQDLGMMGPEAGDLRLCIIQSLGEFPIVSKASKSDRSCSSGAHEIGHARRDR